MFLTMCTVQIWKAAVQFDQYWETQRDRKGFLSVLERIQSLPFHAWKEESALNFLCCTVAAASSEKPQLCPGQATL